MNKSVLTLILLVISNSFMTLAWYGHLKFKDHSLAGKPGLLWVILISWGIALFEYMFQVPANRIGFVENGGPFTFWQLKIIQEAISISVFVVYGLLFFRTQAFSYNHAIGFGLMILAVYFFFRN